MLRWAQRDRSMQSDPCCAQKIAERHRFPWCLFLELARWALEKSVFDQ